MMRYFSMMLDASDDWVAAMVDHDLPTDVQRAAELTEYVNDRMASYPVHPQAKAHIQEQVLVSAEVA